MPCLSAFWGKTPAFVRKEGTCKKETPGKSFEEIPYISLEDEEGRCSARAPRAYIGRKGEPLAPLFPGTCPGLLGVDADALAVLADALEADVLLLLDDALPDDWEHALSRFGRIIDVVGSAPEEVESSRSRYRAYRAAGAELAAYDQAR